MQSSPALNAEPFGDLADTLGCESSLSVKGTLVIRDTPWGRHVDALLRSLREQGNLHHVGLATEFDLRLRPGTNVVEDIVRVYGVYLVARSSAGGRFCDGDSARPPVAGRRGDIDVITGFLDDAPSEITFVTCPVSFEPRRNEDGTWRVLEAVALALDPDEVGRLGTFAKTKWDSHERGAFFAGTVLDHADRVHGAIRSTPGTNTRDAEKDGGMYHGLGVSPEMGRGTAIRRQASLARGKKDRSDQSVAQAAQLRVLRTTASRSEDALSAVTRVERVREVRKAVALIRVIVEERCRPLMDAEAKRTRVAARFLCSQVQYGRRAPTLRAVARDAGCSAGNASDGLRLLRHTLREDPRCASFLRILGL